MSETIDKRVVQMRFDNAQFENGVKTTMGTLDKLKKALHLDNAVDGIGKVQSAFSKFDVSGVGNGIDAINAKFSTMQMVAFSVMQNIVNDAYAKGKQLAEAFTIEPVLSGFQEYETQINAVQTILANTQNKGSTLEDVNRALDELNHYADLTIYNFTEMTRNIGTFTAAGIDLQTSVDAIKGIANLAAVSGSTSYQASTAMYQLSQALAAGTVNLQDWNSVVNAGMGGQVFQEALKRTARQMGQDVDGMIEKFGSFRLSLSEGKWLTADVLTETLKQFSGAYTEADLIQKGYSESQAAEIVKMAETATNAATKVKTFTQLFDTLKEAAQSGWTQTWEIIIGDFEEAKDLLTGFSDYFSDIINKSAEKRNNFLEEVFSTKGQYVHKEDWENLTNNGIVGYAFRTALIDTARAHGIAIDQMIAEEGSFSDSLKNGWLTLDIFNEVLDKTKENGLAAEAALNNTGTTVENLKNVVAEVIRGNWGAGDTWKQALIDAGYNMEVIRDLVNQTFDGSDYDLGRISEETWAASAAMAGYGDAIRDVSTAAYFAGNPVMDLVDKLQRPTGRELLIESVWNVIKGIGSIIKPVKEAFDETFSGPTAEGVYQLIAGFEKLTEKLNINFSTSLKIKSAFKGLFAVFDIGFMAINSVVDALIPFGSLLGPIASKALNAASVFGKFLSNIRDGIRDTNAFGKLIESGGKLLLSFLKSLLSLIKDITGVSIDFEGIFESISNFFTNIGSAMVDPDVFYKMCDAIKKFFSDLKGVITGELDIRDTGFYFVAGFIKGLGNYVKMAYDKVREFGSKLLEKLKEVLGIHSPSEETKTIGQYFAEGFLVGLRNFVEGVYKAVRDFGIGVIQAFKEGLSNSGESPESAGKSFVEQIAKGLGVGVRIAWDAIKGIVNYVKERLPGFIDWLNEQTNGWDISTILGYLKDFASAKFLLSFSSFLKDLGDGGIFSKIADILETVKDAISGFGEEATKQTNGLLALAEAFALLTLALYGLSNIDNFQDTLLKLGQLFSLMISGYAAFLAIRKVFESSNEDNGGGGGFLDKLKDFFGLNGKAKEMKQTGNLFIKLAASVLILAGAMKLISTIDTSDSWRAIGMITVLIAELAGTAALLKLGAGSLKGAGSAIFGMATSVLILTLALKRLSDISIDDYTNGIIRVFTLLISVGLAARLAGKSFGKGTGFGFIGLAASLLIIIQTMKQLSEMNWSDLLKGIGTLLILMPAIVKAGTAIGNTSGGMKTAGLQMILLASAMFIFAKVAQEFAKMNLSDLAIAIVGISGVMFTLTKAVQSLSKNSGKGALASTTGIILMGVGLLLIAQTFDQLSQMSWDTIKKGILTMAATMLSMRTLVNASQSIDMKSIAKVLAALLGVVSAISIFAFGLGAIDEISGGFVNDSISKSIDVLKTVRSAFIVMIQLIVVFNYMVKTMQKSFSDFSVVGLSATIGKTLLSFVEIVGGLTLVLSAIGGLVYGLDYLGIDVIAGINKCGDLLYAIGNAFGRILGGAISGVLSFIPDVGTYLSKFAVNAIPFFTTLKTLSPDDLNLADILTRIIVNLAKAEFLNGLNKLLGFGSGNALDTLENDLGAIGDAVTTFAEKTAGINTDDATRAAEVAQVIANLYENLPKTGGIIQDIFGEQDLSRFGEGMQNVAEGIVKFAGGIASMKNVNVTNDDIEKALYVAQTLSELQNNLPETGGKIQAFFGEKSLANFGTGMGYVGTGIKNFIKNLGDVNVNADLVDTALYVAQTLAELQNNLPASGGTIQDFFGSQDLEQFGNQMGAVGSGINAFVTSLGNVVISDDQVNMAENVGTMLANLEGSLTKHDGTVQKFFGDSDFGVFAANVAKFGDGLKSFSDNAKSIDEDSAGKAIKIGEALSSIENSLKDDVWWSSSNNLDNFSDNVSKFGEAVLTLNGIDNANIAGVVSSIKILMGLFSSDNYVLSSNNFADWTYAITELGEGIATFVSDGMTSDNAKTVISDGAKTMLTLICKTITDNSQQFNSSAITIFSSENGFVGGMRTANTAIIARAKTMLNLLAQTIKTYYQMYKSIGESLFRDNFLVGIQTQSGIIVTTTRTIAQSMWQSIANYTNSFYSIGVQLMAGLTNGINANGASAINAAAAVAAQALRRSRDVLGIHSPSKEFYEIGRYSVLGMSNGLIQNTNLAENAAGKVSDETMAVMARIAQKIQDMLDGNLEYTPTIRPIIDDTYIQNGVSAINGMFGNRYLGTLSNLGYVSGMRSDRGNLVNPTVEVDNQGVVDAINNVGKRIDNLEAAMNNMQIQIDGNATVGQLYNKMDKRLGQAAKYKQRGI